MKMQSTVYAPVSGKVARRLVQPGQRVETKAAPARHRIDGVGGSSDVGAGRPPHAAPRAVRPYNPVTLALSPGDRLGVYEVTASIGAGGMGQVWRARDTKLNRDVALKVLPDSFAKDPDRIARFTREAQTLAALNHPNIASIYGIEDSAGVRALVMELVDGEDLSEVIARHGQPAPASRPERGAERAEAGRVVAGPHPPLTRRWPADRRCARHRRPDRRGARRRARAGHRPSRPETRQHQSPRGRHREGARLRARESHGA